MKTNAEKLVVAATTKLKPKPYMIQQVNQIRYFQKNQREECQGEQQIEQAEQQIAKEIVAKQFKNVADRVRDLQGKVDLEDLMKAGELGTIFYGGYTCLIEAYELACYLEKTGNKSRIICVYNEPWVLHAHPDIERDGDTWGQRICDLPEFLQDEAKQAFPLHPSEKKLSISQMKVILQRLEKLVHNHPAITLYTLPNTRVDLRVVNTDCFYFIPQEAKFEEYNVSQWGTGENYDGGTLEGKPKKLSCAEYKISLPLGTKYSGKYGVEDLRYKCPVELDIFPKGKFTFINGKHVYSDGNKILKCATGEFAQTLAVDQILQLPLNQGENLIIMGVGDSAFWIRDKYEPKRIIWLTRDLQKAQARISKPSVAQTTTKTHIPTESLIISYDDFKKNYELLPADHNPMAYLVRNQDTGEMLGEFRIINAMGYRDLEKSKEPSHVSLPLRIHAKKSSNEQEQRIIDMENESVPTSHLTGDNIGIVYIDESFHHANKRYAHFTFWTHELKKHIEEFFLFRGVYLRKEFFDIVKEFYKEGDDNLLTNEDAISLWKRACIKYNDTQPLGQQISPETIENYLLWMLEHIKDRRRYDTVLIGESSCGLFAKNNNQPQQSVNNDIPDENDNLSKEAKKL